jgi:hypothetical protein
LPALSRTLNDPSDAVRRFAIDAIEAIDDRTRPNFTGDWVLVELGAASDAPATLTVTQTDAEITIQRSGQSAREHYRPGITRGHVGHGPRDFVRSRWAGAMLVIESRVHMTSYDPEKPAYVDRREVWTFDPAGQLVITRSTRTTGRNMRTDTETYRPR